ncbi:MAG: hypothetical protein GWP91_15445 [Rhodobacterales bacterium]|nr:hypothetical protein [Rhodobacterales bacterium]
MAQSKDGSRFLRATAAGGNVRILAVDALEAATELQSRHGLVGLSAKLAAETVVASVLLSAHIKGDERITVQLQGSAPKVSVFSEVDANGNVRGRAQPASIAPAKEGQLTGLMMVIKSSAIKEMYRGVTEIDHGSFEAAFLNHLGTSAALDVVLRIRAELDGDVVSRAVGVMVEKLPGHAETAIEDESRAVAVLEVLRDQSAEEMFDALEAGEIFGEEIQVMADHAVRWLCHCNREKVLDTLVSLGPETLQTLIDEDDGAEVTCHFCNDQYRMTAADLRRILPIDEV